MTVVGEIVELMMARGVEGYFGEPVSQLEHALQAAWFAAEAKSAPTLIAAALLHDVGHLLHGLGENIAADGIDAHHEELGYRWLLSRFGLAVAEPVRLHVAAKRYMCHREPEYFAGLSPPSIQSLALQGGPFSEEEFREFERMACYRDACQLRRWDDAAKVPRLQVPGLNHYLDLLARIQPA